MLASATAVSLIDYG